ncbi:MAG: endonuclease [Ferruginibacter sp.]
MKKYPVLLFLMLIASFNSYSQCTAPNLPTLSSLILNNTDTQLAIYFDTTANAPATNIYYLGILSTSATLGATPANGTVYAIGDNIGTGNVIFYDKNYIHKKTGLTPGTTYYLFIYTTRTVCTGEPFYSTTSLDANITTFINGAGIPPNYYDAVGGLTCTGLKTSLFNIIKPAVANPNPTYTGLWSAYYISDDRLDDAANKTIVWDLYTDKPTGTECEFTFGSPYQDKGTSGTVECQRYNREHAFPQSWFSSAEPMRSDMFIVYPTDKKVNGMRGNFPYGVVTSPTYTSLNGTKLGPNTYLTQYTGIAFEPINEYKGDLARSTFYVATAYENNIAAWKSNSNANDALDSTAYPCFDNWYLKMLYQWHLADPVSTKEIDRNNDIYMMQGNRNPYIDHPEYVALVWQCSGALPVTIIDFTAQKNNESVLLKWYATAETNFKKYEIERSTDGSGFYKIGGVAGRNLANYAFTDNYLPNANTVFYRLKMIDIDGQFSNSKIVSVRIANNFSNAQVYPNPTKDKLVVKLQQALTENSQLIIADLSGRIVMLQQVTGGQKNIDLTVSHLQPGRYFIKISNATELINQAFVIIK